MMKKASDEKDLPDFREVMREHLIHNGFPADQTSKALQVYSKAVPDATFVDIEKKLREENFNIFLIALVRFLYITAPEGTKNRITISTTGEGTLRCHQLD